jgi:hypothetical protein
LHNYALSSLNIEENIATDRDIEQLFEIKEKHFHFDPGFFNLSDNILIRGYFQTEKYFLDIEEIIIKECNCKHPAAGKDRELLKQINSLDSVSLHIRRGDYVTNTYEDQILVSAELEYYNKCVKYITETIKEPHFFIFSDDPDWVKQNLTLDYPMTFLDHNDASTNYEDLRLMSHCNHNIICNSSFSWWGAWLNRNPEKIVCAPKKWFSDETKYIDSRDLVPERWVKF